MLGEAATTAADAERYYRDYENAIHAIGKAAAGRGVYEGPAFPSSCRRSIRAIRAPRRRG